MKSQAQQRRSRRASAKISGSAKRPRARVFRSLRATHVQLIDDVHGHTLVALSSKQPSVASAGELGEIVAKQALALKIDTVVFDRGGYKYHGRVQALADGMRKGGLAF